MKVLILSLEPENNLDKKYRYPRGKTIDFDLKIVRGFALTFFIYGVIYWLQIKEFLVPLPMVYFFVPVTGLIMFFRSLKWGWSFVFILIPSIVIKDFFVSSYPNITAIVLIITFLAWSAWAWSVFYKEEWTLRAVILPVSQSLIWLIWLVQVKSIQLSLIAIVLIGITVFVRSKIDKKEHVRNVRVGLLIQLILSLFLMQQVSNYWVALN